MSQTGAKGAEKDSSRCLLTGIIDHQLLLGHKNITLVSMDVCSSFRLHNHGSESIASKQRAANTGYISTDYVQMSSFYLS